MKRCPEEIYLGNIDSKMLVVLKYGLYLIIFFTLGDQSVIARPFAFFV